MLYDKLNKILEDEMSVQKQLLKEYSKLPKGNLLIKNKNGYTCFYLDFDGIEKGIKKNKNLLNKLARKRVVERSLDYNKMNCAVLSDALRKMNDCKAVLDKRYSTLTFQRIRQLDEKDKIFLSVDEYNWKNGNYRRNPYKPESLIYTTNKGIKVRSKSERTIANILERDELELVYLYEPEFVIENAIFYPDFVIRRKDGKFVIWEHFGLMDKEDYYLKACNKIRKYRQMGFVQHSNLICTYEEDIESEKILEGIIDRFLI